MVLTAKLVSSMPFIPIDPITAVDITTTIKIEMILALMLKLRLKERSLLSIVSAQLWPSLSTR